MRRDPRGRIYFVDHTTRTTTWQRPSTERLAHFQNWQGMRSQILQQGKTRFLYSGSGDSNSNAADGANASTSQVSSNYFFNSFKIVTIVFKSKTLMIVFCRTPKGRRPPTIKVVHHLQLRSLCHRCLTGGREELGRTVLSTGSTT